MPKPASTPTTTQSLGALLKTARDIMRKDILLRYPPSPRLWRTGGCGGQEGLNGDLDRLPMLTSSSSRRVPRRSPTKAGEEAHSDKSEIQNARSEIDQSLVTEQRLNAEG